MPMASNSIRDPAAFLIVTALLILALVLGREVLMPLALATILAFILAPVVRFPIDHRACAWASKPCGVGCWPKEPCKTAGRVSSRSTNPDIAAIASANSFRSTAPSTGGSRNAAPVYHPARLYLRRDQSADAPAICRVGIDV
jgi:hypothetical protein